jgi:hypothetical protein
MSKSGPALQRSNIHNFQGGNKRAKLLINRTLTSEGRNEIFAALNTSVTPIELMWPANPLSLQQNFFADPEVCRITVTEHT